MRTYGLIEVYCSTDSTNGHRLTRVAIVVVCSQPQKLASESLRSRRELKRPGAFDLLNTFAGPSQSHVALSRNDQFLFRGNFRNEVRVNVHVRRHCLRRETPQPIVQRNVHELIGLEHL